jgi:hypothetical protein
LHAFSNIFCLLFKKAVLWIHIRFRIDFGRLDLDPQKENADPDPGGEKMTTGKKRME